jgi:2-dehydro-3-deoxygalactonokinase
MITESCAVYVDAGTTNTRVWLLRGDRIVAHAGAMIGVRDTARDGSSTRLEIALRDLISGVLIQPDAQDCHPGYVAAAGMITSSLGLVEVPHVTAPAGAEELAANVRRYDFPDITHLPVLLVPGVRTGFPGIDLTTVESADLMRGEETICIGLVAMGLTPTPCTVLNLGSHWKVIGVDEGGRITKSITSLTGEMIHTIQTQTILASAVPHDRPRSLDPVWVEAGMREQRRAGLARAMFCVRLLEQGGRSTPEERLAFLIGAFIASDLDALMERKAISDPVIITGGGAIAKAWQEALERSSLNASVVSHGELERALLMGLQRITAHCAKDRAVH